VPGVMPDKWLTRWRERERRPLELSMIDQKAQFPTIVNELVDLGFVRAGSRTQECHHIQLYDETMVVVIPIDHAVTAYDEVTLADLCGEQLLQDPAEVAGWEEITRVERLHWPIMTDHEALELAATGAGIVVLPQSVARLYHRKDLTYRRVVDLEPQSIGLAWRIDNDDEGVQTFIGIVRGRTERSSRG